jgi:putative Holliday junction resolvase
MSRYLGVDYGKVRVGIAISDETESMATPLEVLPIKPFRKFIGAMKRIIRDNEVSCIVVGIPRNMDGSYGLSADAARDFASRLRETLTVPIEAFDERLTTVQAAKSLREAGKNTKKQKDQIDSAAAQIILQTYLDYLISK